MEVNKIICGDCLEEMKKIEDNSVDFTITSPPYNAGKNVRGNFYKNYSDDLSNDEYYLFIKNTLKELIRINKKYIFFNFQILSGNKNSYLQILSDFKENIKEIIIWHKKQVQPAIQPTCLSSAFEFIIVFSKKELAKNRTFEFANFNNRKKGQLNTNIIYGDNMSCIKQFNKMNKTNKATFPEYFVKWFIDKFTKEKDIILDPFAGTGTTLFVAKQNKRRYLGIELDKEYCNIINLRLKQGIL